MRIVPWCRIAALLCIGLTFPVAPLLAQVSVKLLASEGADFDYFGEAVDIDGDYAIVGSWLDDNARGRDAGAARIFHRVGAVWEEQALLLASDGETGDQFGIAVAINGDVAFVGAHRDDNVNGAFAGAVYIYERSGETWTQREKIVAGDGAFDDRFGGAVASSGDRLLVGAIGVNEGRGGAYVYHRAGGDWLFVNRVTIADGMPGDAFGGAVAIEAEAAIVGAATRDGGGITDAGAAYALAFNGVRWIQQQELIAASPGLDGIFGKAVAITGDQLLIGAPEEDVDGIENAGAAYVFQFDGTTWTQQAKLGALNAEAGDAFGFSVAIDGTYAIAGARWDLNNQGRKSGAAYVFVERNGAWESEARLLAGDGDVGDQFGNAVAVSNEQVMVGARWDDNEVGQDAGAAYIFPIGGSGVPSLLSSRSQIDFSALSVGESEAVSFTITNIGTADLNVLGMAVEGAGASNFTVTQGSNSVLLAPLASITTTLSFSPVSPGDKMATLRIESNSPSSPHEVALTGSGTDGLQPGIAKVIAFRGDVESYFGSTVSVLGDYAIVGAEGQRDTEPGAAYIYKRSGDTWVQELRISSLDGEAGDRFGSAVDISSTHAIVGAWSDDNEAGAAYIFVKSGSAWIQQAKLIATDREAGDRFGQSVSIEGTHAVVGAWQDDNIRGSGAGAAYIYNLEGGTWQQQFKLTASDGQQGDRFGSAVAVQGTDVLIGAANGGFFGEGTAYVYSQNGSIWQESGRLSASQAGLSDGFGTTVAIEGDIAVVGAPIHDNQSSIDEGAVYVFEKVGTDWVERVKLAASDGASGYEFGRAVDIAGGEIAVGAAGANNQQGAMYLFSRSGDTWFQTNIVTASDGDAGDKFGTALAFTGFDIITGAPEDNNVNGVRAGVVYIYLREGAGWEERARLLASSRLVQPAFGAAVAIDGDYAVVGAKGDTGAPGAAYVYFREGENWTQQTELSASDSQPGDQFGVSVAISGAYIVVGASGDDNERGTDAGAAYVFLKGSETWSEQARLIAGDGEGGDAFGGQVAIDGDLIGVGAPLDNNVRGEDAGGVYVFQRSGAAWLQQAKVTASDGIAGDFFGVGLDLQQTTLVAGAPNAGLFQSGAVYVYEQNGAAWNQAARLSASNAESGQALGSAVAVDENYIIVGSEQRKGDRGAAYIYRRTAGVWAETEELTIELAESVPGDGLGGAVAISGVYVLVGGQGFDNGRGAAYLFERSGSNWLLQTRIDPQDEGGDDAFGLAVALQGGHAVVGAQNDNNGNGIAAGSAYLLSLTGQVSIVATEDVFMVDDAVVLYPNYPNPFVSQTTIPYEVTQAQHILLEVYDMLGRHVATLVDEQQAPGAYAVALQSLSLASGVYFCRLKGDAGVSAVQKLVRIGADR
ncbi:MAG: choice-of-anchor D domain-containing protein [Bacteroidota bacterium]